MTKDEILKALSFVLEPDLKKDVVSLNLVSNIGIDGDKVTFDLKVQNNALHNKKRIEEACIFHIQNKVLRAAQVQVSIDALPKEDEAAVQKEKTFKNIDKVIAIASGKGGVGKSTITANLAAGLAKKGFKVGLIDADIYGPSIPMMFDVMNEKPGVQNIDGESKMLPVENYGVKIISIGFFSAPDQAIVWRGPMASKALTQMFNDVEWGELDYLFIDLPPGTGDIHLTIVQSVPLTGAVVVSTPQPVALADARKGIAMFNMPNINIPILGLVENMSYFSPPELSGNKYYIFGEKGVSRLAEEKGLQLLGEIPIIESIREAGDVGRPAVLQNNTAQSKAFDALNKINLLENKVELLKKVNKALENVFNFVKQDGGELKIIDLTDDMVLQVELNGACRTCDMNTMTFKAGVEETILKSIPEIKSVEALNFSFEQIRL